MLGPRVTRRATRLQRGDGLQKGERLPEPLRCPGSSQVSHDVTFSSEEFCDMKSLF